MSESVINRRWRPNRSLSPAEKVLWLGLLCGPAMLIAVFFALAGIWLVLPFAGIEVMLLVWAFREISRGDQDFECLTVGQGQWMYQARIQGEGTQGQGSLAWLKVEESRTRGRLEVALRYSGRQIVIGRFLPEDQRARLAKELSIVVRAAR